MIMIDQNLTVQLYIADFVLGSSKFNINYLEERNQGGSQL